MARKRTVFAPAAEARFLALVGQGWTSKAITEDLNAAGVQVSRSTVDSRMREVRGHVIPPRGRAAPSFAQNLASAGGAPKQPTEPSEDASGPTEADLAEAAKGGASTIDSMLTSFVEAYNASEPGPVRQRWGALILKGLDDRRKATPPEKPDPNDVPDMVALGAEVEARFFKMVDMVLEEIEDPR